jgi:hypothetical protein
LRFAVRRPGCPVASPRSHGVPRRDVPGRIHIGVAGVSAGSAPEDGLALTRLPVHLPARTTALAGVMWPDSLNATGCLVIQPTYQQPPARPQNLSVEAAFSADAMAWFLESPSSRACHVPDLQVLDPNEVEPTGKTRRDLLSPVLTPVSLASTQPSDGVLHSVAPDRSLFRSREPALQQAYAPALTRGKAGNREQFSSRQGRRHRHASVNPYHSTIAGRANRIGDHGEGQMPPARAIHRYPVRFCTFGYWARPAEPHPSSLRHPNLSSSATQPLDLPGLDLNDPEPLMPPCLASRRTPSRIPGVKEGDHRLGEVPERLLLDETRACGQPRMFRPCLGELPALLYVARRAYSTWTPMRVLLDRQVPYIPSMGAMVLRHRLLGNCGDQPIAGHVSTVSTRTDISEGGETASWPRLNTGAFTSRSHDRR